jgi:hypothetical protein
MAILTMARVPSFRATRLAWLLSFLGLFAAIIPTVLADSLPPGTITGTNAAGVDQILYTNRYPALYTGDFGDCMGGESLLNLTSFDAALYTDNLTVLFDLTGTTNLKNEAVMRAYSSSLSYLSNIR